MRSKQSEWYEIGLRYKKVMEDGTKKFTTEHYVVEALSFSQAESRIVEEMMHYISDTYEIKTIKKAAYKEVFFSDVDKDDKWYKAKLQFITIDAKTKKEKFSNFIYLVQSSSLDKACISIDKFMGETMTAYSSMSLLKTKLMDVFELK